MARKKLISETELKKAVRRGIALLERRIGPEWRRLFKIKDFVFEDSCKCVIGTVGQFACGLKVADGWPTGNAWDKGRTMLGFDGSYPDGEAANEDPAYYGFDYTPDEDDDTERQYRILADLWKKVLKGEKV